MDYKAEKIMPYGKKESKTQQVREMFDSIAPVYDFMNRAMTFGIDKLWRRKAVGFLRRKGVQSLLDVATGTGDFAMLLCRKLHPKRLVGVDLSENMLSIAQQKAQRAREIAKKETEKLFAGTEVVHNPVKEFVPLKDVKVGQEVCIAELNQLATVLALPDKNGDVLVRAGIIKTKVPLKGLKQPEKLVKEPTAPKTKAQQRYSRLTGDTNRPNGRVERVQRTAKMECNLLGLTVDEALSEVDSFIDRAILNGQTVVYLIHGNGTGALRTAIHKHLRGNRMVKSFRLGRYGEGESGVTVVELK